MRIFMDDPEHGWMGVHLEIGENSLVIWASYTPNDCLDELAEALLSCHEWGEGHASFHTEPTTYEFVFRRENDQIILEVFELPGFGMFIEHGTLILRHTEATQTLLLTFWRALRHLESRFDRTHWNYDFPSKAVERLGVVAKKSAHSG